MSFQDDYIQNNYGIYGDNIVKQFKMNKKEFQALKEENKKKGIYMLPVTKLATPTNNNRIDGIGGLQLCVSHLQNDDQQQILELAKNVPDPSILIDQTIALQQFRVGKGVMNEEEQGHLLDSTETAISNLLSMIQTKKVINEGQDINVNVNNSITSILDEIEKNESNIIDINY